MKIKIISLVIFFLFFLCASANFVSAGYTLRNYSLVKNYNEGDIIRGFINISFEGSENLNFSSNFGYNQISLLDFLNVSGYSLNSGFSCTPPKCKERYEEIASSKEKVKQILNLGNRKQTFGFIITGEQISRIDSFAINVSSNAQPSCRNQLTIDLLDDDTSDFFNTRYSSTESVCGNKIGGCYDSESSEQATITNEVWYCERIIVPPAPGYRVYANIKKNNGQGRIAFAAYLFPGGTNSFIAGSNCEVNEPAADGEISCVMNFSRRAETQVLFCLQAKDSGGGGYSIGSSISTNRSCSGASGQPGFERTLVFRTNYDIKVQPLEYGRITNVRFDDVVYTNFNGGRAGDKLALRAILDYITREYNRNCTGGCVIPFSLSGVDDISQQVTLGGLEVRYYDNASGQVKRTDDIYKVFKRDPIIDTNGYVRLNLDRLGFAVPNVSGNRTFILNFGEEEILREVVNVYIGFSFNITPLIVPVGIPVRYVANATSPNQTIVSSVWNFGDNSTNPIVSSPGNYAEYTYYREGDYLVEVSATNSRGERSLKKFLVSAGQARTSANLSIQRYEQTLQRIDQSLRGMGETERKIIEDELKLTQLRTEIAKLREDFRTATNSQNYSDIIQKTNNMRNYFPLSVSSTVKGSLPFEAWASNINIEPIEKITQKAKEPENVKRNLIGWIISRYSLKGEFEKFVADMENGQKVEVLTKYKITVIPKANPSGSSNYGNVYLIIGRTNDSVIFKQNYNARNVGGGVNAMYIQMPGSEAREVEFYIRGANTPKIENLGIYISPEVRNLENASVPMPREREFPWRFFLIALGIVILFTFVLYIILQEWYKRNYERSLFKNPDDLYNVINFIYNARANGEKDEEIKRKLLENKWKKEQVVYAFKKLDGKRTGMWEIPLFKSAENKKVKEELSKKNPGKKIDARFIKQTSYY